MAEIIDINKLNCETCKLKVACEKEHGSPVGEYGTPSYDEGYTSVIGTHFCRASWEALAKSMNYPLEDLNIDI